MLQICKDFGLELQTLPETSKRKEQKYALHAAEGKNYHKIIAEITNYCQQNNIDMGVEISAAKSESVDADTDSSDDTDTPTPEATVPVTEEIDTPPAPENPAESLAETVNSAFVGIEENLEKFIQTLRVDGFKARTLVYFIDHPTVQLTQKELNIVTGEMINSDDSFVRQLKKLRIWFARFGFDVVTIPETEETPKLYTLGVKEGVNFEENATKIKEFIAKNNIVITYTVEEAVQPAQPEAVSSD